jgi:hypothetical protein
MATVNQMMPLSGQPKRFSFHIETSDTATRTTLRNTIKRWLKALNVSSGCTALASSIYLVLEGFGEPSVCLFSCGFSRSWACGTSLSVMPGSCLMILLLEAAPYSR